MQNLSNRSRNQIRFKRQTDRVKAAALFLIMLASIVTAFTSHAKANDLKLVSQFDAITGDYRLSSQRHSRMGIELIYSSKSRHRGLFGWGWCSDLDASIKRSDSGKFVYLGCEFPSGDLVDPREAGKELKFLANGRILRARGDGVEQVFGRDGGLIELRRPSGETASIVRKEDVILVMSARSVRVVVDPELRLAREIEEVRMRSVTFETEDAASKWRLKFDGSFLAGLGNETYQYDAYRRMIVRERADGSPGLERELVGYLPDGRGIGRFERQAASPENRLLVTVRVSEESGKIEIKAERGAEMHPVRIFYDIQMKTLELFGDRQTARSLLQHLMS